jgi:hypothetical protein
MKIVPGLTPEPRFDALIAAPDVDLAVEPVRPPRTIQLTAGIEAHASVAADPDYHWRSALWPPPRDR